MAWERSMRRGFGPQRRQQRAQEVTIWWTCCGHRRERMSLRFDDDARPDFYRPRFVQDDEAFLEKLNIVCSRCGLDAVLGEEEATRRLVLLRSAYLDGITDRHTLELDVRQELGSTRRRASGD